MAVFIPPTIGGNARRDRALYTPVLVEARSGRDENGHNIAQPWPRGINFFASSNEYNRLSSQKIWKRSKKNFIERNGRTIGRNLDDLGQPGVKNDIKGHMFWQSIRIKVTNKHSWSIMPMDSPNWHFRFLPTLKFTGHVHCCLMRKCTY